MQIILNGEKREVPGQSTLEQIIIALGLEKATIAAECDGSIVDRDQYAGQVLSEGMRVELIRFVGGGAC